MEIDGVKDRKYSILEYFKGTNLLHAIRFFKFFFAFICISVYVFEYRYVYLRVCIRI